MNAIEILINYAGNEDLGDGGYAEELASNAATEITALYVELEYYELARQEDRKRIDMLIAEVTRLRLIESAAKKLLAVNPTQRWTVDEMNALDDALKAGTK